MGVNFGIEYLYASVAIESPVGLPNKASFVKFGPACGIKFDKISSFLSFLRVSVVMILVCRAAGRSGPDGRARPRPCGAPVAEKTSGICRYEKD